MKRLHLKAQECISQEYHSGVFKDEAKDVDSILYKKAVRIIEGSELLFIDHLGESHGASDKRCFFKFKDQVYCFDFSEGSEESYYEDNKVYEADVKEETIQVYTRKEKG